MNLWLEYLKIFCMAMLPLAELRLAIPYAAYLGLPLLPSYIVAILGNMLPVPFIYFLARKILIWGAAKDWRWQKIFSFFLAKGEAAGERLQQKARWGLYIALLLFVGIPLPGTGAWTGILAASILDMDFKKSSLACMGGVLLAGLIMAFASLGVLHAFGS